jgi:hypothetical protein
MNVQDAMQRLIDKFGSRESFIGHQLVMLSQFGQPADITFYNRDPILNVTVDPQLALALAYGAGPEKLKEKLEGVRFSDGTVGSLTEIWTINPMPKNGFTEEELMGVDLGQADEEGYGPGGETMRKIISETYKCKTREEEDHFLRRFIAS